MNLSWQKLSARGEREGVDVSVCMSFCMFWSCAHCGLFWLCVSLLSVFVCVRMFALLKGLAQRRPFVVGNSGHSAHLVWFMDVSQNCISLRPERDTAHLPGVKLQQMCQRWQHWTETDTSIKFVWHPSHAVSLSNSYINSTQKRAGEQIKTSLRGWFHAAAAGEMSRFWKFNRKMFQSVGGQSSAQSCWYILGKRKKHSTISILSPI